jgi:hypothetical protein
LLACIDGACDLEANRRREFDYPLLPPEAAIDRCEDEVSIDFAIILRAQFAQDSPAVRPRTVILAIPSTMTQHRGTPT